MSHRVANPIEQSGKIRANLFYGLYRFYRGGINWITEQVLHHSAKIVLRSAKIVYFL